MQSNQNQQVGRTKEEIEEIVIITRLFLYNQGLHCGPKAIKKQMNEEEIHPIPSESTIGQILSRNYLTHGRTGYYEEDYC